ncbi:hypothetical protein [Bdellovibrio sp. HCB274]|uniref:hypothetical protein n=1 Tax=Bdellovibrio sp. HCB274 TaxID=3394361 RepID=UPI0039B5F878
MRLFTCTLMALLFGFPSAWALQGFDMADAKYVRSNEQIPSEPISMPPFSSQDSAGVCYSFAAAAVLDQALCKQNGISDCKQMTEDQRVSPIDVSRYSKLLPDSVDSSDRFNYEGLQFDGGFGGSCYSQCLANWADG